MFKNSVTKIIGCTTFPKTMLMNRWFYNVSGNNVARSIGFSNTVFGNVGNNGFDNIFVGKVVKPIVSATCFSEVLSNHKIYNMFRKSCCLNHSFYNISKHML